MKNANFTVIEQLTEISKISKDTLILQPKQQEDIWIIKLEIFAPKRLNQELINI